MPVVEERDLGLPLPKPDVTEPPKMVLEQYSAIKGLPRGKAGITASAVNGPWTDPSVKAILIRNEHATQDIYVAFDATADLQTGIRIFPKEVIVFPIKIAKSISVLGSGASTDYQVMVCYG